MNQELADQLVPAFVALMVNALCVGLLGGGVVSALRLGLRPVSPGRG